MKSPAGGAINEINASYSTAHVLGRENVGGLVGVMGLGGTGSDRSAVVASYATGSVGANPDITSGTFTDFGGLIGWCRNCEIAYSYARGAVSGGPGGVNVGGLIGGGLSGPAITLSYFDGDTSGRVFGIGHKDSDDDNVLDSGETNSLPGRTTAELQTPTAYAGIYAGWNVDVDNVSGADDPWDFGTATQYPALRVDFDGNGVATPWEFGGQGRAVPANTPPSFGQPSYSFNLAENADGSTTPVPVGTAAARDADGDPVRYSFASANLNKFAIDGATGEITYIGAGENYESLRNPANAYRMTVRASDANDALSRSDVAVTVAVTDVNEPPGQPAAAMVTAPLPTRIEVSWTPPANTGPPITEYRIQYTYGSNTETVEGIGPRARSRTIDVPNVNTAYSVQVRAINAEGPGAWSPPTSVTTPTATAPHAPDAPSVRATSGSRDQPGHFVAGALRRRAGNHGLQRPLPGGRHELVDGPQPQRHGHDDDHHRTDRQDSL